MSLAWAFVVGAGDGSRTRAVSLGIVSIMPAGTPDLAYRRTASDLECPLITNGPLTACHCGLWPARLRPARNGEPEDPARDQ